MGNLVLFRALFSVTLPGGREGERIFAFACRGAKIRKPIRSLNINSMSLINVLKCQKFFAEGFMQFFT